MQVGAFALEDRMRREREEYVEIARGAAAQAGLAFAGEPDAGAVLDAGRHMQLERAFLGHAAGAAAIGAGLLDDGAAALAGGAGALEREEALRVTDAAGTAARAAGDRLGAGLGAGARADFAGDAGRQLHLRGLARIGFLERDLEIVAQVRAALAAGAAATTATHAEQVVENVVEGGGKIAAEAVARAAVLEGGVAEAIIGRALLIVLQDVIGLVDLLEAVLAGRIARILVRVPYHGELTVRGLDLLVLRGAGDLEDFVIVALGHGVLPSSHDQNANPRDTARG